MSVYTRAYADAQNEKIEIKRVDENNAAITNYPKSTNALPDLVALVGAASGNDGKWREFSVCDLGTGALKKVALMASDVYT